MELTLERKRLRKPNLKSRNQPDVYGNRTRSGQKSREARRQSRGSAEAGAEAGAGAGAGGDDQQALLQLPPRVQSGTAAAVVRRAAATLAWAAGDGSVLSTAETLIARMHPRDASGAAHALAHAHAHGAGGGGARARIGMSALQGSFHIPTLPPSALLRPPPTSTEMLVQALRRQQQRERLADPRNMRRFLDAVIHEYVDGPAPQGQAAPPPPSRARRPPKQLQLTGADSRHNKESGSKASSRGAAAAAAAASAQAAGLLVSRPPGPPPCPSYETLVRRVEKPLMPSRLLRAVPSAVAARVRPTPATAPAGPGVKPSLAHRRRSHTRGATPATAAAASATAPPPPQLPSRKALAAV